MVKRFRPPASAIGQDGFGLRYRTRRADVEPQALMDKAVSAAGGNGALPEQHRRERSLGRVDDRALRQHLDPGEDERRHLPGLAAAGDPALRVEMKIALSLMAMCTSLR